MSASDRRRLYFAGQGVAPRPRCCVSGVLLLHTPVISLNSAAAEASAISFVLKNFCSPREGALRSGRPAFA